MLTIIDARKPCTDEGQHAEAQRIEEQFREFVKAPDPKYSSGPDLSRLGLGRDIALAITAATGSPSGFH
jgi:hypothetical protein